MMRIKCEWLTEMKWTKKTHTHTQDNIKKPKYAGKCSDGNGFAHTQLI